MVPVGVYVNAGNIVWKYRLQDVVHALLCATWIYLSLVSSNPTPFIQLQLPTSSSSLMAFNRRRAPFSFASNVYAQQSILYSQFT